MARGTSLSDAVDQLRYELKETVNAATGKNTRDHRKYMLRRVQQTLADEYYWPFLRVTHFIEVAAGQRYYDFPSNLPFENVEEVNYRYNGDWLPLAFGIGPEQYNIYDSGADFRTDPVARWAPYNEDAAGQAQIEIWPIPSTNGYLYSGTAHGEATYTEGSNINGSGVLRFQGIRSLNPLIEDDDTLDLDDTLVVLYAAWELAADEALANKLLQRANRRKEALMNRQHKTGLYKMQTPGARRRMHPRPINVRASISGD